jgi:hypothetical protein
VIPMGVWYDGSGGASNRPSMRSVSCVRRVRRMQRFIGEAVRRIRCRRTGFALGMGGAQLLELRGLTFS